MNCFEHVTVKNLMSRFNVCAQDWGENDCIYAFHKFYYFMEGEATLIIEGDVFTPQPEDLFLIPANTKHSYSHNPNHPVLKYWSHFNLVLDQEQKLIYHRETVKCSISQQLIVPTFEALVQTDVAANPLNALTEKTTLLQILKLFLERVNLALLLPANTNEFSNKVNSYIRNHLQSEITLAELANLVHLHPNYFIKYFKKYFNVTPIEYVNTVRLQMAAKSLIHDPHKSIERIADEVGFNDYRYFSRLFKKKYGVSPSQYKGV
ncbi:helix-turn-helix transcriptional regulator [Cohnella herbarum]|uniref:AraC family transcriptional regulator n=1 Tax=Cohnella herbarum TaxID=2728023 RepID=A0A7Z2VPJ1_9BACL|nr:AraC family transcriptional regulator [Cohnella herbarum]QJD87116.1 AraC family transcriptional regulator [Cohnella herbarum]